MTAPIAERLREAMRVLEDAVDEYDATFGDDEDVTEPGWVVQARHLLAGK